MSMNRILTTADVKERLGIGINQARRLVARKDFPKIVVGRRYLIPEEEFEEWIHNSVYKKYDVSE